MPDPASRRVRAASPPLWLWGFAPFALASVVHVAALAVGSDAVAAPTKLLLMPLLAIAVLWAGRGSGWGTPYTLLFLAIALSWLGDGAATFLPQVPTLPAMLAAFGLAHVAYMWLFWRHLPTHRLPRWTIVYAVWWVLILVVLWPLLGGLAVAVALYGLVLGGTATLAARCHPIVAWGGAFFLASDTILAFRLFTDAMPDWTSPLVMLTYCVGQGLLAAGVVVSIRARSAATRRAEPAA